MQTTKSIQAGERTQKPGKLIDKPTKAVAVKIIHLLSFGLVHGLGKPIPGQMCVEAAVCYAMGMDHSDKPKCVGYAVRDFKIQLNDCCWPSNKDRAEGMKQLAIAQLGSDELDQMEFGKLMFMRGTQRILPFIWRKESEKIPAEKKAEILDWCAKMEAVMNFNDARTLTKSAYAYASAYDSASAYAYAYAYASAYAYAYASAYDSASASASASAYASAHDYAYDYAYRHDLLKLIAQVGVDVLCEMKSPGCKWLYLCD